MTNTQISDETLEGYATTDYRIQSDPEIIFHIDEYSEGLKNLFSTHGVGGGAFVTAFNPQGKIISDGENQANHARLTQEIVNDNISFITCIGSATSSVWPAEIGFFLLGVEFSKASEIGIKFDQDAIVWVSDNAVPQLVLLR